MNKFCEQCLEVQKKCTAPLIKCKLLSNKIRIEELDLAKPYLSSEYYWKRLKELKNE